MTEVPAGRPLTVLLLAGQREGRVDPLAEATGVTLKAMVPVAGCPMLLHALTTLAKTPTVGRIVVSINAGSGIESLPEVAALIRDGRLDIRDARPNLVDSVFFALEGQEFPVLITTADNVLLTPATVREIDGAARARGADVAVALAGARTCSPPIRTASAGSTASAAATTPTATATGSARARRSRPRSCSAPAGSS
ncbi:nucleotidyltransferase family protein [Chenggangzhangella methanolivorans]|uniref:Nucleotidyltransferase family protein n=1 Tax=Chenggangzhangella methanolivorans TaxID=1437009 RepID=A0A9E6R688_9HYPH|nr:nucleotidyltransferase family protein [Chenggangzhangella methanolivorans]QZN98584.1 nucleotidyltransferase family protein [Chenggangzhangella methanolivorans]